MIHINQFWQQPAQGFDAYTIGRTEEQLLKREAQMGFRLPELYRELMKLQNGGYIRKRAYPFSDGVRELFYNGATLDPISEDPQGYSTFLDFLNECFSEEEIRNYLQTDFYFPERLPILSHMDGHSFLCFDYGWLQENPRLHPEICLFDVETLEPFVETLRVENFQKLVENLCYAGYESASWYIGFHTQHTLEEVVLYIAAQWQCAFEARTDDNYGWYNFDKWWYAFYEGMDGMKFRMYLTPNQFKAQTYLFPHLVESKIILEINDFDTEITNQKINVVTQLYEKLVDLKPFFILQPTIYV